MYFSIRILQTHQSKCQFIATFQVEEYIGCGASIGPPSCHNADQV